MESVSASRIGYRSISLPPLLPEFMAYAIAPTPPFLVAKAAVNNVIVSFPTRVSPRNDILSGSISLAITPPGI
jgi:hypothetical protein